MNTHSLLCDKMIITMSLRAPARMFFREVPSPLLVMTGIPWVL